MPTMLSGSRADRVEQAHAYSTRAEAVVAKTRNLIALEAEQAYFRWLEASSKLPHLEKAADEARVVFEEARRRFAGLGRITVEEWLRAGTQATELRLEANQARYRQLLALASLERVTGGAFHARFEGSPTSTPQTSAQEANKERESGTKGPER
jgi:outer membrane protein TolC